ncbi:MAG: hypothetical protein U0K86_07465 [Agathobacter sp.]|nr:hypothetical protein [Agathobacter sp.]
MKATAEAFCFDTRKRTLYTLVVKEENELEECPMLHQFLDVLKEDLGDKFDCSNEYLLQDKFLIMDFDDIFMPIDENVSEVARNWREDLQKNAKDLIENGLKLQFDTHIVHMMPFDKSGNMSRKGRISFVNQDYAQRLNERLNLGIDFSKIKLTLNKYYAYRGLYLSNSQRVNHENFKLTPETLVIVKDTRKASGASFERDVKIATAKEVQNSTKDKSTKDWEFQEPELQAILNTETPYDGEGLITPEYSGYINESLGIKGANSFQIRLPFAKGMLHQVDVIGFIDEYTVDGAGEEQYLYVDAFGIERDLSKAHIFMTESMLKCKKWLIKHCEKIGVEDPMQYYCEAIAKYNHGFYVSGTNLPYGHSKYTHLSYQAINTLAFDDNQFKRIMNGHGKYIEKPIDFLKNWDEIEYEDVVKEDCEESYHFQNWKRAVLQNPSLAGDKYIKEQLENTQKSLLSKIALGKVLVEGQTRYLCRDLAPLLFSLLRSNKDVKASYLRDLYNRFYLPQGNSNKLNLNFEDYYAFFRNPHLSRNEQYIMRAFVLPKSEKDYAYNGRKNYEHYTKYVKMYDKYFGHLTGIVMVPRGSTLPLCLGGADFDGDLVSVILNQDVVDAVAKAVYQWNSSNSLYYYTRKMPAIAIPSTSSEDSFVSDFVEYQHVYNTFSNNIGRISNAAISIGQVEYERKKPSNSEFDANAPTCDKCTLLTGLEIDAAKNGSHPNLDIILQSGIPKSLYLSFLRQFKKLKAEDNFHLDRMEIKEEKELKNGVEKRLIVIGAQNCETVVKWYPDDEENGTYINLLPKYFIDYYKIFAKLKKEKTKASLKIPKLSKNEKEIVDEFKETCCGIFELYSFYKNILIKSLKREKAKGFYAVENTEVLLMRMYDESQVEEQLFQTLSELRKKIEESISSESEIDEIRDRINILQWQFQPRNRRGAVLEQIIGNGFKEVNLSEKEKELLYHFNQQGYKLLWRLLDIIQGPKICTYSEMYNSAIKSEEYILYCQKFSELNETLDKEARRFYENNESNIEQKIYAHCLKEISKVINTYFNIINEKEKLVYALYQATKSKISTAKFFWDVFSWEDIELIINVEEAKG